MGNPDASLLSLENCTQKTSQQKELASNTETSLVTIEQSERRVSLALQHNVPIERR